MLGATTTSNKIIADASYGYRETIETSQKVNWRIEDIIGGDKKLDFSKQFMPESLARVEQLRPSLNEDDYRVRAFLQFAGEEVKHIQLFKIFCEEFRQNFGTECKVIGPASEIGKAILAHDPLSVALVILMIEWMTQDHYVGSIKDDAELDPLFKSLLKNHWLEEAQHAKLDTRMVESLAEGLNAESAAVAIDGFLAIGGFLDAGLKQQTLFDLEALELATGRTFTEQEREQFIETQHQANRWTYIGSGMMHSKFLQAVEGLGSEQRERIESVAPAFC